MVFVFTTIVGGYFMIPDVLYYKGETTFYMANESFVDPSLFNQKGQLDPLQVSLVQERAYQMAYSTDMMTHLIKQFHLYDHYKIDTTTEYHFEEAVVKLTKNLRFNKITTDLSSIIVFDRNNELAAAMANAMVWKLDDLNKKYLNDKIQSNLNFYQAYLDETIKLSKAQNENLSRYMDILYQNRSARGANTLSEVEFSLYEAVSGIQNTTSQLITARNLYQNALSMRKAQNLPSLVIVKKAIPDLDSKKPYLLLFATLGGVVGIIVVILLMYFYFSNRTELQIVFGAQLPEKGKMER